MLKKTKKNSRYKILILLVTVLVLVAVSIICLSFSSQKSNFKVESRLDKVKEEKKNDDDIYKTVGWIRVQGTNIDMPVIAVTTGADLPITRERYSWTVNRDGKFYNSMRIYGHNVLNLSMTPMKKNSAFTRFEELLAFIYYDFAEKNQYMQLTMDGKEHVYKIFAVGIIKYRMVYNLPVGEHSKKDLKNEIEVFKENTIYDYNTRVTTNDNLLSLVTCTRIFGDDNDVEIVVSAKEVDNHSFRLSKIKKTKKYSEINKAIKGDGSNEENEV